MTLQGNLSLKKIDDEPYLGYGELGNGTVVVATDELGYDHRVDTSCAVLDGSGTALFVFSPTAILHPKCSPLVLERGTYSVFDPNAPAWKLARWLRGRRR